MTPRPVTDQTRLGFAKFLSWTSLVLILVSSLILSVVISNSVRSSLLRKQQEFSTLLAENLNHQIYRRFTLPTIIGYGRIALRNEEQYQRLDQVVQSTIHGLHVKSLRIFDYSKVVAYASDRSDLGDSTMAGMAVTRALTDNEHSFEIEAAMSPVAAMFHFSLPDGSFTLRTTYPLRVEQRLGRDVLDEKDQPVMGVLEITQDITADYGSVIQLQWLIVLTTMASSCLLFLLLVTFIRHSEKVLSERMEEKQKLERDLHQSEKLASMGRVVSSIAHEIRNPLGIISSSAELLLKRPNTDALTQKILTAIHDEAKRLSKTVHDFLDYARPKSPKRDELDVAAVLDQALGFLEHELSQHEVTVVREYAPGLVMGGDKDLLYRAFYNVISNALQAIGTGGRITIAAENREGSGIIVAFHDSGAGFDLTNMDKMLDPFFTTKDDGTGLGLAIVNSIITSHGGEMMLSNADDGGAVVRMRLPAAG